MDKCKKDNRPCIFSKECCEPEEKKMTNADRIRNMTDEELAKFLELTEACGYNDGSITDFKNGHYMDMLEWLQAEVKEGNSNENT